MKRAAEKKKRFPLHPSSGSERPSVTPSAPVEHEELRGRVCQRAGRPTGKGSVNLREKQRWGPGAEDQRGPLSRPHLPQRGVGRQGCTSERCLSPRPPSPTSAAPIPGVSVTASPTLHFSPSAANPSGEEPWDPHHPPAVCGTRNFV